VSKECEIFILNKYLFRPSNQNLKISVNDEQSQATTKRKLTGNAAAYPSVKMDADDFEIYIRLFFTNI